MKARRRRRLFGHIVLYLARVTTRDETRRGNFRCGASFSTIFSILSIRCKVALLPQKATIGQHSVDGVPEKKHVRTDASSGG